MERITRSFAKFDVIMVVTLYAVKESSWYLLYAKCLGQSATVGSSSVST